MTASDFGRCLFLVAALLAARVRADNVAAALFDDGKALMEAGKYDEACPKLAASHHREPGGDTVLALAICLEKQGKIASAYVRYQEAVSFAKKAGRKDRLEVAEPRIAALAPRVPYVVVTLSTGAAGAVVSLDGEPLEAAAFGTPVPVDPGSHTLVATIRDKPPFKRAFVGVEGATVAIEVPPFAADAAPIARAAPSDLRKPVGIAVTTFGVLSVGVGGFLGVVALQKQHAQELACPRGCTGESLATARSAYDSARTAALWSTVGFAVGAIATGVGIYILLGTRKAEAKVSLHLAPIASSTGAGLSLSGAF